MGMGMNFSFWELVADNQSTKVKTGPNRQQQPGKTKNNSNLGTATDLDEVFDTVGQSKFVLKNLQYYTDHPNLARYYESLKPTPLQVFLFKQRKVQSFLLKVAEYDQDKTLLILTNNPLPCPFNQQEEDTTPNYFSKEFLSQKMDHSKTPESVHLPPISSRERSSPRTSFSFALLKDLRKEQWFRFSISNDFKTEGKYSKLHALRKQIKTYPHLNFVSLYTRDKQNESKKSNKEKAVSVVRLKPLTLAELQKDVTTKAATPGDRTFRHGRAKQWILRARRKEAFAQQGKNPEVPGDPGSHRRRGGAAAPEGRGESPLAPPPALSREKGRGLARRNRAGQ
ncbi:testis-specific gene 13 protein [Suncus etruscus]|uniref:testis-specific gene 13 protein n=1 Tax=Suncus etruscus TaxID=109475 RepID=UPI0021100735|nr:testis-specific gene 13 protein [Suncus etruscus]